MTALRISAMVALLGWLVSGCPEAVPGPDLPPEADAGDDQELDLNDEDTAFLDGSGSYDPDGDTLTYRWDVLAKPAGDSADLNAYDTEKVSLSPSTPGVWVFALNVQDSSGLSDRDVVQLLVIGKTCSGNADCVDDEFCDGQEACEFRICVNGDDPCEDDDPCTEDTCNEVDDACSNILVPSQDPEGPVNHPTCDDDVDNDCDGLTDHEDPQCGDCNNNEDCDDNNACTIDNCRNNVCGYVNRAPGFPCNDSLFCNGDDACNNDGFCQTSGQGPCTAECMTGCSEATDQCAPTPTGLSCEGAGDGLDCTIDRCDGVGACSFDPEDSMCTAGTFCLENCSIDATGCVAPPSNFSVSCGPRPSGAAHEGRCTVRADTYPDQQDCILCETKIVQTTLDNTDFSSGNACFLDGWTLEAGQVCAEAYIADGNNRCTPQQNGGAWVDCCDDFDLLCAHVDGEGILSANRNVNCGADLREWRLEKMFDFRGFRDAQLCLSTSEDDADDNEHLVVYAYDSAHGYPGDQIICHSNGLGIEDNDRWYHQCWELPEWTDDTAGVSVVLVLHSHDDNDVLRLKNVSLRADSLLCTIDDERLFINESFDACDGATLPSGVWTVTGDAFCDGFPECTASLPVTQKNIEARGAAAELVQRTDISVLDDRINLCFYYGESNAGGNEYFEALFDTGGENWQSAWLDTSDMGSTACKEACVNLAELDPAVKNNPDLGVKFVLNSTNNARLVDLGTVKLRGQVYCDGSDHVNLETPVVASPGVYNIDLTNLERQLLTVRVTCKWPESTDAVVQASGEVTLPAAP